MRKLLLCITCVLIILIFSGCGQNKNSINDASSGGGSQVAASPSGYPHSTKGDHKYLKNLELLKAIKDDDKKLVRKIAEEHPESMDMKGYLEYRLNLENGYYNFKSRLATPLLAAILTGHNDIAYMLIKMGVNSRETGEVEYTSSIDGTISGSGPEIWSPLFAAVQTENTHIAKILIENGSNINIRGNVGRSLLHIAVNKGKPEMVELLLEKGADVNACDSYGSTPIASALTTSPEIVEILKKAGARGVERLASDEGDEILKTIVDGNVDKVRQMVENDAKLVNARGHIDYTVKQGIITKNYVSSNATPLLIAAIAGKTEIVKYLVDKGAKIDRRSQVTYAMTENDKSENYSSYDWTALIGAVSAGNADIAKFLISSRAKIDATTSRGLSPLLIAVREKNMAISEMLLAAGADYNTRDASGSSVIEQANRIGDIGIIDLLKKYIMKRSASSHKRDASVCSIK